MSSLPKWVAQVGFCGLSPVAPGTCGSLFGLGVFYLCFELPFTVHLLIIGGLFALGTWACHVEGRRTGEHDASRYVIDEVVGVWIACLAAPPVWWGLLLAFLLFRVFDIWKPPPIRRVDQNMKGGLGVMMDDVLAGVYAALVLILLQISLQGSGVVDSSPL